MKYKMLPTNFIKKYKYLIIFIKIKAQISTIKYIKLVSSMKSLKSIFERMQNEK